MVYVRDLLCHLYLHHYVVCRMGLERRYDLLKCTQQLVSQAAIRSQCSWLTQQPFLPFRLESEAFNYVLTKVLCVCVLCCVYKLCVWQRFILCVLFIYMWGTLRSHVCAWYPQERVLDHLELELLMILSHMYKEETVPKSSARATIFFYPLSYISSPFWEVSKYNFYTFLEAKKPLTIVMILIFY